MAIDIDDYIRPHKRKIESAHSDELTGSDVAGGCPVTRMGPYTARYGAVGVHGARK